MRERNRPNQTEIQPQPDPGLDDPAPVDNLAATRAEVDRLLSAADNALERILTSDSQTFLSQGRQTGGQ